MRQTSLIIALLAALVAGACGGGGSGGDERRVLVDFSNDEFATFIAGNFPAKVTVRPGQTIVFKQTWTGEPHTVTGGTLVNAPLKKGGAWLAMFNAFDGLTRAEVPIPDPENPGDVSFAEFVRIVKAAKPAARDPFVNAWNKLRSEGIPLPDLDNPGTALFGDVSKQVDQLSEAAFDGVLFAGDDDGNILQNVGQACFLKTGGPPEDPKQPCSKADQVQPEFDGTQSFYNSGILKYEGPEGNTYRVKLADTVKPGTYLFYCAVHGPQQLSEVVVRPKGAKVPSQGDVSKQARAELDEVTQLLAKTYRDAVKGSITLSGRKVSGPFAGLYNSAAGHAAINEFVPKTLHAKVNEPITWKMMGADHTITFNVPKYFPIVDFNSANGIEMNPKLKAPAGGAPEPPEQQGEGVLKVDGGTYSGTGFWSSGLVGAEPYAEYTLRIAKPGTYYYACLVHPPRVGKLIVS
jgi:plastocyanin